MTHLEVGEAVDRWEHLEELPVVQPGVLVAVGLLVLGSIDNTEHSLDSLYDNVSINPLIRSPNTCP